MLLPLLLYILLLIYISFKKFRLLVNPFTLEIPLALLFIVLPQLIMIWLIPGKKESIISDVVIALYVTGLFLGAICKIKMFRLPDIKFARASASVNIGVALMFLVPTFGILLACGLNLAGIRCYYETVVFSKFASFYALAKSFLMVAIILLLIKDRKFRWYSVLLILATALSGSKAAIFNLVIFIILFNEVYRKVSYRKIALFGVLSGILLVLYHFSQTIATDENPLLVALKYFDLYDNQAFLIEELNKPGESLYHGKIYLSTYYQFIPRILWPGKPTDYGFAILNYDFLPEYADVNYMPSFGLGQYYADFGFIGAFCSGFGTGFFRSIAYSIFKRSGQNNSSFFVYYSGLSIMTFLLLSIQYILSLFFKRKSNDSLH